MEDIEKPGIQYEYHLSREAVEKSLKKKKKLPPSFSKLFNTLESVFHSES